MTVCIFSLYIYAITLIAYIVKTSDALLKTKGLYPEKEEEPREKDKEIEYER